MQQLVLQPLVDKLMQALAEDIALPYLARVLLESASRLLTSSSDWRSLPTMGATSVDISVRIILMDGALARRRTPYRPP